LKHYFSYCKFYFHFILRHEKALNPARIVGCVGIGEKAEKKSFLFLREKQEQKGDHHCHRDNEEKVEDRLSH